MSQQRPERASKIKAAENMAAMVAQPLPALTDSGEQESILLRFTKDVWNDYESGRQSNTSSPKSKAGKKCKRKAIAIKTEDDVTTREPKGSSPVPRQCKVKITRFQYGGPDARVGGKYRDMITLEAPCLQPTCANCWKWHAHLMRSPLDTDASLDNVHSFEHPETSPLSPAIDPRILDDKWRMHSSRRNSATDIPGLTVPSAYGQSSASSTTPVLTPVDCVLATQRRFDRAARLHSYTSTVPAAPKYNVFLPKSLLRHTASQAASFKTRWREAARQSYTVRLSFSTDTGKVEFMTVLHEQARKEIKRERDCLRRLQKEVVREVEQHLTEEVVKKARRRHRLKLVFKSETGKENYKRLI